MNEQDPHAVGFTVEVYRRTDCDKEGGYPLAVYAAGKPPELKNGLHDPGGHWPAQCII